MTIPLASSNPYKYVGENNPLRNIDKLDQLKATKLKNSALFTKPGASQQHLLQRLLSRNLGGLIKGDVKPDDKQLINDIKNAQKLLKTSQDLPPADRQKLEAAVKQLEKLRDNMTKFTLGNASYSDVAATLNNVQFALRGAGLLPKTSRNPFNNEAGKVPDGWVNAALLRKTDSWTPPAWILQSNDARDITVLTNLSNAAYAYRSAPTVQNWNAFEQARNKLHKYFQNQRYVSIPQGSQTPGESNGKVIKDNIMWADWVIARRHLPLAKVTLDNLQKKYIENPSKESLNALREQINRVENLGYQVNANANWRLKEDYSALTQSARELIRGISEQDFR